MIALTLAEIAAVTGGVVHGDPGVVVDAPASPDSRAVETGGLFVAISGEQVDGHEYAVAAMAAGAAAVLGSRPTAAPTVVVADAVSALGTLARHVLDRLPGVTVARPDGLAGEDRDEGLSRRDPRRRRAHGRDGREPQQRARRPTDRAARDT